LLIDRSRVENPFSSLPDKIVAKIEEAFWETIEKDCTVSMPGKDDADDWFEAAQSHVEEELKRLFDLTIVTESDSRGPMNNPFNLLVLVRKHGASSWGEPDEPANTEAISKSELEISPDEIEKIKKAMKVLRLDQFKAAQLRKRFKLRMLTENQRVV
jgi:hypothetical protein